MTVELKQAIGLRVKRARENAGLTQERLAELVDRTKDAISSIERGVNFPSLDTLYSISSFTKMPVSAILEEPQKSRKLTSIKADIDVLFQDMTEKDAQLCLSIMRLIVERKFDKPMPGNEER